MRFRRRPRRNTPASTWRRVVAVLLVLALLGVLAATVAPLFHGAWPLLGLFQHFSVQLGAAALLLLVVALAFRMWREAALAVLLTLLHGIRLEPFLPYPEPAALVAGSPLKVLSLNLWYENEDHMRTVQALLESGADVIATVETTAEWRDSLQDLASVYPYRIDCVGKAFRCGVALFSKLPFQASFAGRIDGALPTIAQVTIDWQGEPLTIAALQLINPLIGIEEDFQAQQAEVATDYFAKLPGDLVVMGDFNSTPWSRLQKEFRARTGLDNRGRLAFTWPSWAPGIFRLPIDQIFVRGGIVARNVRPGAPEGSDHLPILGDIYRKAR
ncbi:endonuclease/exonuclease/phosphatase family protein [Dongia sedimenti]|uniref:Endonuclease/exonuclease/phosphatase family protein n=1 Tax=Dongia sedimenti TaxID=3064282 RepID=A0ABU0YN97_9PROT|nr:endonuclease/exonuclease/phosphatase family protein [Rhodospirillaceae bacterium R-7]